MFPHGKHISLYVMPLRTLLRFFLSLTISCQGLLLHEPIYGSYTELYAGISSDITPEQNGAYIIPWGRVGPVRPDIELSLKSKEHGGNGKAARFWDWCAEQCKPFE